MPDARDHERLHFLHVSPTFGAGGREMRAVELLGMLPPSVRHTIVALDGCLDALERVPAGVECRTAEPPRAGGLVRRLGAMRAFVRDQRADLVLTYNWGAIEWVVAARAAGRPVVHHEDGFGPDEATRQLPRRVWFRRAVLRSAFAVVVPSWRLFELARATWRVPDAKLLYLPNGVDVERFHPAVARDREDVVFTCVGRVRPEKNQALAVEALSRMKHRGRARLRIVGDGPDLAAVQALASERGVADRVEFTGARRDTAPEYRVADVFVIPSNTEQMPLALLEAMASALPVVTTDVGDVRRMVAADNQRWVVAPGDVDAFAHAMDEAATDDRARATLGGANREKALTTFEKDACYGRYVDLYLRAAGARR